MTITPDDIRFIRSKNGLTQTRLARVLGVETTTVARWEQGVRQPDALMHHRLERMLAVARDHDILPAAIQYEQKGYETGGPRGRQVADAGMRAEMLGLSPLAMYWAGSVAMAHAYGESEQQWLMARANVDPERRDAAIQALKDNDLWPWVH